jgi:hypothetical protein
MFTHRLTRVGAVALAVAAAAAPAAVAKPTDATADWKLPHGFQTADSADAAAAPQRGIYEPMRPQDQPQPAQDIRNPDTIDAANGRGTEHAPEVVVVEAPAPQPVQPAADGMDWADIGLGAGTVTGLALVALGGGLLIVRRRGGQQLA